MKFFSKHYVLESDTRYAIIRYGLDDWHILGSTIETFRLFGIKIKSKRSKRFCKLNGFGELSGHSKRYEAFRDAIISLWIIKLLSDPQSPINCKCYMEPILIEKEIKNELN